MNPADEARRLRAEALGAIAAARSADDLEAVRIRYLGRKGAIRALLRSLGGLPAADRPAAGAAVNAAADEVERVFDEARGRLGAPAAAEAEDITLPGDRPPLGSLHPIRETMETIEEVFASLGFAVADGPEVETDARNFEALNIAADHPARDLQDTFFVDLPSGDGGDGGAWLLRTHTSPVQIRVMTETDPPVRVIAPGRVFRRDEVDASHSPVFHQVEGLCVAPGVRFSDLRGTLAHLARALFGAATRVRFRPSYFPFVEPGAEVDVSCPACAGGPCRLCKGAGFLEMLGAGMVHPDVFRAVDRLRRRAGRRPAYDPARVSGWAFGVGVERIAMVRHGIDDMRLFYENDARFLRQFSLR
jgi:phenylalanyl-tRNA synthetase alpha chain